MHVLFVHANYPAQFGHIAERLVRQHGFRCTFVSRHRSPPANGIEHIRYQPSGGATRANHYLSRTFENNIWSAHAVYQALAGRSDLHPDVIVGHSGFGSTLFLRELFDCGIVNYFEYFYSPRASDLDFRPEFVPAPLDRLRAIARNAMILSDLNNCDYGYSPTEWQRRRLPPEYQSKVRTIFDGIDTEFWRPERPRLLAHGDQVIPPEVKVVTYVARGFEAMRGFDIFLQVAQRLATMRRDVHFVVVGEDRICYGGDEKHTGEKSFKEWALARTPIDPKRFLFTGAVPPATLRAILGRSDLHLYFTVPFVLSWSLFDALACAALVLASATAPVCEVIRDGENGLLCDFFDVEGWVERADEALSDPHGYARLRAAARRAILDHYSLDVTLPKLLTLLEQAHSSRRTGS